MGGARFFCNAFGVKRALVSPVLLTAIVYRILNKINQKYKSGMVVK
jgi:hypothetical protein